MPAPEVELSEVWRHLAGSDHEPLLAEVLAHHREPHRRYHTATHVMWVLRHITHIAGHGEPLADLPAVQLAALYHDIVYDPRATDNEARSALLAGRAAAALGWPAARRQLVERLVLATAGHAPCTIDEAVLVDADLAILGAAPDEYAAYVHAVRSEYAHVADDAWRVGRAAVLREFLARPTLFTTATMVSAHEETARANLTAELMSLVGPAR